MNTKVVSLCLIFKTSLSFLDLEFGGESYDQNDDNGLCKQTEPDEP